MEYNVYAIMTIILAIATIVMIILLFFSVSCNEHQTDVPPPTSGVPEMKPSTLPPNISTRTDAQNAIKTRVELDTILNRRKFYLRYIGKDKQEYYLNFLKVEDCRPMGTTGNTPASCDGYYAIVTPKKTDESIFRLNSASFTLPNKKVDIVYELVNDKMPTLKLNNHFAANNRTNNRNLCFGNHILENTKMTKPDIIVNQGGESDIIFKIDGKFVYVCEDLVCATAEYAKGFRLCTSRSALDASKFTIMLADEVIPEVPTANQITPSGTLQVPSQNTPINESQNVPNGSINVSNGTQNGSMNGFNGSINGPIKMPEPPSVDIRQVPKINTRVTRPSIDAFGKRTADGVSTMGPSGLARTGQTSGSKMEGFEAAKPYGQNQGVNYSLKVNKDGVILPNWVKGTAKNPVMEISIPALDNVYKPTTSLEETIVR